MVSVFPAPVLRWVMVPPPDPVAVDRLARALGLPPALAALLVQRGQGDEAEARNFLRPAVTDLSDPGALAGMAEAVEAIAATIRAGFPEGPREQRGGALPVDVVIAVHQNGACLLYTSDAADD